MPEKVATDGLLSIANPLKPVPPAELQHFRRGKPATSLNLRFLSLKPPWRFGGCDRNGSQLQPRTGRRGSHLPRLRRTPPEEDGRRAGCGKFATSSSMRGHRKGATQSACEAPEHSPLKIKIKVAGRGCDGPAAPAQGPADNRLAGTRISLQCGKPESRAFACAPGASSTQVQVGNLVSPSGGVITAVSTLVRETASGHAAGPGQCSTEQCSRQGSDRSTGSRCRNVCLSTSSCVLF
jgi:hypothetical protein